MQYARRRAVLSAQMNPAEGSVAAQAVSCRPLGARAGVRSQVSPCGIYGRHIGTGTALSPSTRSNPISMCPAMSHPLTVTVSSTLYSITLPNEGLKKEVCRCGPTFTDAHSGLQRACTAGSRAGVPSSCQHGELCEEN
jgi:hypothetical protein